MGGNEGGFSVKLQAENLFFLGILKIKMKQNPDCLNKEYNTISKLIYPMIMTCGLNVASI